LADAVPSSKIEGISFNYFTSKMCDAASAASSAGVWRMMELWLIQSSALMAGV
jgi:hypothetical protein